MNMKSYSSMKKENFVSIRSSTLILDKVLIHTGPTKFKAALKRIFLAPFSDFTFNYSTHKTELDEKYGKNRAG